MELLNWLKRSFNRKKIIQPWMQYYNELEKKIKFTDKTIYEYLKNIVEKDKELIALNYFGKKITYEELLKEINKVSKSLWSLGVRKKDIVTVCLPNQPEAVYLFYAINKIGAIADFIHPLSAPMEIKKYLNESKSRILITADFNFKKIESFIKDTNVYKTIFISPSESMPFLTSCGYFLTRGKKVKRPYLLKDNYMRWVDFLYEGTNFEETFDTKMSKNDTALILHSGGTTGTPKGIMISNYSFNALAQQGALNVSKVKPKDKIMTILPLFHGFGLGVCLHCPLCLKVETILIPEYNPKNFAHIIKKEKPHVIAGVPTLWEGMLKSKYLKKINLSSLKYVISGGDHLSLCLENGMNDFLKSRHATIQITKGYGMTESVAATAYTFEGANLPGSVGLPMIGNKFCICKPGTIEKLGPNKEGEICVTGPTLMQKYLNNKKETRKVLKKHFDGETWLHTGDLGYMNNDGIIYFTQRLKRVIVSSGFNVYPSLIEEVIASHPKVAHCSVVAIPHPYKIHAAKAYIVLKANEKITNIIKQEIKELCEKNLAKYSIPKEFEFIDALPTTLYGKVDYQALEKRMK